MATCRVCRGEYITGKTCPRCGKEPLWEKKDCSLLEFYISPTILLPLLVILAMACAIFGVLSAEEHAGELFDPIYVAVIFVGVVLLPVALYQQRWSWWEQQWAAEIYEVRAIPLKGLIVGSFALALVTGLGFYVLFKIWGNTANENEIVWWQKMVFGSMYVPMHISLMATVTLFSLDKVLERLRNEIPHPIYVDAEKLQLLVQKEALQMLGCVDNVDGKGWAQQSNNSNSFGMAITIEQKGHMQFHMTFGLSEQCGSRGGQRTPGTSLARMQEDIRRKQRRQWKVVTDRWGRIQSLRPRIPVHVVTGR